MILRPQHPSRLLVLAVAVFVLVLLLLNPYWLAAPRPRPRPRPPVARAPRNIQFKPSSFNWTDARQFHPITTPLTHLPEGNPLKLPPIQHAFVANAHPEAPKRQKAVRDVFEKGFASYKRFAWGRDELRPVSAGARDTFGGWAASLVDALDTLWIMGFEDDFYAAAEVAAQLDWAATGSKSANMFETTIRHLGGLLGAYDLSGEAALLDKARELGDMLYMGFDTPNRMPGFWLDFEDARAGRQVAGTSDPSAAACSLALEFSRLSQLTGDMRYFDAVNRVRQFLERTQFQTRLPGLWPKLVDLRNERVDGDAFTLGALADSLYEYLPKMHALLGGLDRSYERMYVGAMAMVEQHVLFRPMTPDGGAGILFAGDVRVGPDRIEHVADGQHLACFVGGMLGLGGKLFSVDGHVELGDQVARGCAWAYEAMPAGVMPEMFGMIGCFDVTKTKECAWDDKRWRDDGNPKLAKGFRSARDTRYILRPEAIESVFLLYRMTGQQDLQDIAWRMFQAVVKATETEFANSAISDVTVPPEQTHKTDSMESFWFAETLKYFYLIFSPPDLISLDDYVFNTEAHPFKIPKM
ncbi:Endoplasmic reticulum mannosyl-oligosaccharide 1,2-alpha-mannosidase [Colletotrichum orbiculare MAFF 240422]|uniref:alpha-1,2-Mannosidase n=1 Tax=Colletotrichum orbiculare (strain 104-T / ATCC 96160 / CBS 514.97 / LARS 414 / MAFF 240422) TaxID=1213857 RepID=N4V980_COLOR|nr:Endoplasmic reticulum mannosyl-oligosaccharide 1,2-alpha-mannosidase [Colletotrichum orbiculare MAFF 240422]